MKYIIKIVYTLSLTILLTNCSTKTNKEVEVSNHSNSESKEVISSDTETSKSVKDNSIYGIYEFERMEFVGDWSNSIYTKEKAENKFKDMTFSLYIDQLFVNDSCDSYSSINYEEGLKEIIPDGSDKADRIEFIRTNLNLSMDDFKGYIDLPYCSYPLNEVFIFKDKLFFQEHGAYYFLFTKKPNDNGFISCKENPNYSYTESLYSTCIVDGNLKEAYTTFYNSIQEYNRSALSSELPTKSTTFTTNHRDYNKVNYTYKGDTLEILPEFEEAGIFFILYPIDKNKYKVEYHMVAP